MVMRRERKRVKLRDAKVFISVDFGCLNGADAFEVDRDEGEFIYIGFLLGVRSCI